MKKNTAYSFASTLRIIRMLSKSPYVIFALGGLMGFIVFSLTYGLRVVDPTNIEWLLGGGDIKQHYLGWEFFRQEGWSFPLGAIHQLAYPYGISVTYTDSIPLMAIPFKLFSAVLPEHFQYIGLWGLICYVLQGGVAAMIMRRWSKNIAVILISASFFLTVPMLESRMFAHTALASHWIILASLWVLLERARFDSWEKFVTVWSILFMLAFAIHPYFIPMIALPFVISLILTHSDWIKTVIKTAVPLVSSGIFFWIIGGFAVSTKGQIPGGLGDYALNLNSLYNPIGWSQFLMDIPNASLSAETLNYLGLGILLLVPVVAYVFLKQYGTTEKISQLVKRISWRYVLVALAVVGLCVVAISPRIQFGTVILADIHLPRRITDKWAIFQSSARLFWVVYYMIVIGVLSYIIRSFRQKSWAFLALFLGIFVFVQVIDVDYSANAKGRRATFDKMSAPGYAHKSLLTMDAWKRYAEGRSHMIYMGDMGMNEFFSLVDIAQKYKMTMNTGYFARTPLYDIRQHQAKEMELLVARKADLKQNIYIMKDINIVNQLKAKGYSLAYLNGYYIVK